MQNGFPFQPRAANQQPPLAQDNIASTTSAVQTLTLTNTAGTGLETECTIRVVNQGTDVTAWCYGTRAGLTLANGILMLPNTVETFSLPAGVTTLSVIGSAGGNTFRVNAGDGM
jgi:hypothetical protein